MSRSSLDHLLNLAFVAPSSPPRPVEPASGAEFSDHLRVREDAPPAAASTTENQAPADEPESEDENSPEETSTVEAAVAQDTAAVVPVIAAEPVAEVLPAPVEETVVLKPERVLPTTEQRLPTDGKQAAVAATATELPTPQAGQVPVLPNTENAEVPTDLPHDVVVDPAVDGDAALGASDIVEPDSLFRDAERVPTGGLETDQPQPQTLNVETKPAAATTPPSIPPPTPSPNAPLAPTATKERQPSSATSRPRNVPSGKERAAEDNPKPAPETPQAGRTAPPSETEGEDANNNADDRRVTRRNSPRPATFAEKLAEPSLPTLATAASLTQATASAVTATETISAAIDPSAQIETTNEPSAPAASQAHASDKAPAAPSSLAQRLSLPATVARAERNGSAPRLNDAEQTRFVSRVAKAFSAAQQRGGEIRIRLSPPELGALTLEIKVQGGLLTARVETETPAARSALLDNLPALRERLAEQQIRIDRFDVEVADQSSDNATSGRRDDAHRSPHAPRLPHTPRNTATETSSEEQPRALATEPGRLNVIV